MISRPQNLITDINSLSEIAPRIMYSLRVFQLNTDGQNQAITVPSYCSCAEEIKVIKKNNIVRFPSHEVPKTTPFHDTGINSLQVKFESHQLRSLLKAP